MQLSQLQLHCRAITPMQMNGVKASPQIRAASFRGILRYWLRAALGGICQADVDELKRLESAYFGSQDSGSPLRLRVASQGKAIQEAISYKDKAPLFYAGKATEFSYYPPGKTVTLTLDTHPLRPAHQVFNDKLYAGLLLAFRLGGFGKRARRGSGVLVVDQVLPDGIEMDGHIVQMLTHVPADPAEIVKLLTDLIHFVFRLPTSAPRQPFQQIADYPAATPQHLKLYIGEHGEDNYLAAMNRMWTITGPYHDRGEWAWGYTRRGRRASALHMRVWQDQAGLYYPQVAFLYSGRYSERWNEIDEVVDQFDRARDFIRIHP